MHRENEIKKKKKKKKNKEGQVSGRRRAGAGARAYSISWKREKHGMVWAHVEHNIIPPSPKPFFSFKG